MSPEFEEEDFASPESVKEEAVKLSWVVELLWAAIGLLLTIFSTFAEAFITNPPWEWGNKGITSHSLG
ncbi:MAG: hypothetical protein ACKO5Q_20200, partial [Microcystaceae cyanobacterium]